MQIPFLSPFLMPILNQPASFRFNPLGKEDGSQYALWMHY